VNIDERLRMKTGEVRRFSILAHDSLGVLHSTDLPFDILNLVGVVIPEDFYSLDFDLSAIMADAGIFGEVLGPATQVAIDLMNNLAPTNMALPMPENAPFSVNIARSLSNPLLLEVSGYYRPARREWTPEDRETDLRRHGYVWWADTPSSYTFHPHGLEHCVYLRNSVAAFGEGVLRHTHISQVGPVGYRVRYRHGEQRRRSNGNQCVAAWRARETQFNSDFTQAQQRKWEATMTTSRSASAGIQGYFRAEIGWCIETQEFVFDFTRVSVTVDLRAMFGASFRVKYMAGPVPISMVFTFEAGIGAEVTIILEPSRMFDQGFGNRDWLTVRANTTGTIAVTASAGVEAILVSAGVRARAALNLRADMITQPLVPNFAHRIYVGTDISIGAFVRIGPPWPGFLNWEWAPVFWQFRRDWRVAQGQSGNWQGRDPWAGVNARALTADSTALHIALFNDLVEQQLHNIPNPPIHEPSISIWDENFAVAAWSSVMVDDEYLYYMQARREAQGLPPFDADNIQVSDMIGLANLTNVVVSVWDGIEWSEPQHLTMSTMANFDPVVAVHNGKAVVVFQQMTFEESVLENDFVLYTFNDYGDVIYCEIVMHAGDRVPSIGTVELVYSILDENGNWLAPQNMGISIDGMINDHSVAINSAGCIAALISVAVEDYIFDTYLSEFVPTVFDSVYTIHISSNGQATNQNRILTNGIVNLRTQVEALSGDFNDGFMFSYFTADLDGFGNIMAGRINSDGSLDHDFRLSLDVPNPEYALFTNGSDFIITWPVYSASWDGFGISAVKLVNDSGNVGFSAPILALQPQPGMLVSILDGSVTSSAGGASIRILYEAVAFEDLQNDPENEPPAQIGVTEGQFANNFLYEIGFDIASIAPNQTIPIFVDVANVGINDIIKVEIILNNEKTTVFDGHDVTSTRYVNTNIQPAQMYAGYALTILGNNITDISYTVIVTFSNGADYRAEGIVNVAMPDVSLGTTIVTLAEEGVREFAVNIFNSSPVPLADSENAIQLTFFHDPSLVLPADVTWLGLASPITAFTDSNAVIVNNNELLYLADNGGLSLLFRYVIEDEDLDTLGEIFSAGKRLFIAAEVVDSMGNRVQEMDYSANHATVLLESLMRPNLPSIITATDRFDNVNSVADISLTNLSMQSVPANSGKIVALLTDDLGDIVDTQFIIVDEVLGSESTLNYQAIFDGVGSNVIVAFTEIGTDSTLSNLSLSEIPFVFDNTMVSAGDTTTLHAYNVHNIGTTRLLAISRNPAATISINGESHVGIANLEIRLPAERVEVDIFVTVGECTTTYRLNIHTGIVERQPGTGGGGGGGTRPDTAQENDSDEYPLEEEAIEENGYIVTLNGDEETDLTPAYTLFDDVSSTDWFHDFVTVVHHHGLMRGVAYRRFAPQAPMTRAMFIQVLANLEGVNLDAFTAGTPAFNDVAQGAWYYAAIQWANSEGLTFGVGGGNFAPNESITREQMAALLNRYVNFRAIALPSHTTTPFTDAGTISYWAVNDVTAIQAAGIIGGFPDGSFAPRQTATRAEVATIFAEFIPFAIANADANHSN